MNWGALALPLVLGAGAYSEYRDKKNRAGDLNRAYGAYNAAQNARNIMKGSGGGGRRSGGGGGGGGGKQQAGASILSQYYGNALDLLQPYIDAGKESLPKQTAAFNAGLERFTPFAQMALDPELIRQSLTREALYSNAPKLSDKLVGGSK